jgi:hypothetical protein
MHPKFKTLNDGQKNHIIEIAKSLLKHDFFFIQVETEKGREIALQHAIDTATNQFLKQSFHAKFGEREF